ncbi:hypothetical protein AJ87_40515 [Rhizobium yanglingense]|nr:hypothetical protein AJ87_40515 [Rhizobium yanglingense]
MRYRQCIAVICDLLSISLDRADQLLEAVELRFSQAALRETGLELRLRLISANNCILIRLPGRVCCCIGNDRGFTGSACSILRNSCRIHSNCELAFMFGKHSSQSVRRPQFLGNRRDRLLEPITRERFIGFRSLELRAEAVASCSVEPISVANVVSAASAWTRSIAGPSSSICRPKPAIAVRRSAAGCSGLRSAPSLSWRSCHFACADAKRREASCSDLCAASHWAFASLND